MKTFIKDYKRSIIFSILCFISFFSLNQILVEGNLQLFYILTSVLSILFFLLLYLDHITNIKRYNQKEIFALEKSYYFQHILNHYAVPIALYLFTLAFIYLNTNFPLKIFVFLIVSITLLICLINIRSYFLNKLTIENSTHSVYDGMKLLVFFLVSNTLLHLHFTYNLNMFFLLLAITITTLIGISLIFIRNNIYTKEIFLSVLLSTLAITLGAVLSIRVLNLNLVQTNLILITFFYFLVAVLHHRLERTLSLKIIFNYIFFALITIALMYGMR